MNLIKEVASRVGALIFNPLFAALEVGWIAGIFFMWLRTV